MKASVSIKATLGACVCALAISSVSAQENACERYYLVTKDELKTYIELNAFAGDVSAYAIGCPGFDFGLPGITKSDIANLLPVKADFSDDFMCFDPNDSEQKYLKLNLYTVDSTSPTNFSFEVDTPAGPFGIMLKNNNPVFSTNSSADPVLTFVYDESDNTKMQIKTSTKNSSKETVNVVLDEKYNRFFLRTDESKVFSLYHIDLFNIELPEEDVEDKDNINIVICPTRALRGYLRCYFNYIVNDGEEVSLQDLIDSEHSFHHPFGKIEGGERLTVSLPKEGSVGTTLWVLPVQKPIVSGKEEVFPFGKIFKAQYSDISTALSSPAVDEITAEEEYYTIQGVRVPNPQLPGVYVKRQGSSVSKVLIR